MNYEINIIYNKEKKEWRCTVKGLSIISESLDDIFNAIKNILEAK